MTNRQRKAGAASAGAAHDEERPWHHLPDGTFRNPKGSPSRGAAQLKHALPFFLDMFRKGFTSIDIPTDHVMPRPAAIRALTEHHQASDDYLTWLGHAAFLFRIAGKTVLTDPYLTSYAGPAGFGPKRYVKSGIPIGELPPIDILAVSHNHYDHLDERALDRLDGKDRMTVIAPLRLGDFFRARGFANVVDLDWYQSHRLDAVTVTALPVVHWSRRTGFDMNRTLWAGFAFRSDSHHLFFGGDSAYGPVFKEIGRTHGPFDTALIGIGAYEPRLIMRASHATPEEAVQMGLDLKARRIVGMHWGTVVLTQEPPFEPPRRFMAAGQTAGIPEEDLWIMKIGETRRLTSGWPSNR